MHVDISVVMYAHRVPVEMFTYELSQLVLQSYDELCRLRGVGDGMWRNCMVRQLHKINKNEYIHIYSICECKK